MNTSQEILREAVGGFVRAVGLDAVLATAVHQEQLEAGLTGIAIELEHIALELQAATLAGSSLSEACQDEANCPRLFRFHNCVRDVLTLELPPLLLDWARNLFRHPPTLDGQELQLALSRAALSKDQPPAVRALARLVLFEGVRYMLLLVDHLPQTSSKVLPNRGSLPERSRFGLAAAGIGDNDIDRVAEREVAWWLAEVRKFRGNVRPLSVLLASAMVEMRKHIEELKRVLATAASTFMDERLKLAELEKRLQRMNAPDALMLRNAVGAGPNGQRLSVETLQAHHPHAFAGRSRNALDQQFHRLIGSAKTGQWPERGSPAIVDLVAERIEGEST